MAATYKAQIMAWNWAGLVRAAKDDAAIHAFNAKHQECVEGCDAEGHVGSIFLGKHWNLFPSGRYYAPWSAAYAWERRKDQAYAVALEAVANKYGGWIESGEGDSTDTFFAMYIENAS